MRDTSTNVLTACVCSFFVTACSDGRPGGGLSAGLGTITSASGLATGGTGEGSEGEAGGVSTFGSDPTTSATTTGGPITGGAEADSSGAEDTGVTNDVPHGTTGECAEIIEIAENTKQPADIIFAIDNSSSMFDEVLDVALKLNDFSKKIVASGIDVRVVMVSSYPILGGICVSPPLGSGGCPFDDDNPPLYNHIDDNVSSWTALTQIIENYPQYKDVLRADAATHVIVVTDDDSNITPYKFDQGFRALDPGFSDYKFHAICGAKDSDDTEWCLQNLACCAATANAGVTYLDLIKSTGGEWGDLCLQDFSPVFDAISSEVVQGASLACEWTIPMVDAIDHDKVNVDFDDGMGVVQSIGKVETVADCGDVGDGWYYDDPVTPTKILVCAQTCEKIQGIPKAVMKIKFGCETVIAQ